MAERHLTYRVTIAGQTEALRDLRGIVDGIRKMKEDEVSLEKSTSARRKKIKTEEQKHNEALLRVQIAIEKARARESVRNAEKAEKDARIAKQREEREKTKIAEREAKARERVEREAGKRTIREREAEVRAFERHEREKTRIANREAKAREQEARAIAKRMERESRDLMFDSKRLYRHVGGSMVGGAGKAFRLTGGYATKGLRAIGAGLGVGDGLDLSGTVSEAMLVRKLMHNVLIESRVAGAKVIGGQSYDTNGRKLFNEYDAVKRIRETALKTGTSQAELAQAIDTYSGMGSGVTGVKEIEKIAKQGKLLGGADVVAKLRAQLDISSENSLSEEQKDAIVAKAHFLGKAGVFRAGELANESEQLFSRFAASGMSFEEGMDRYLQFANVAKQSTGNAAVARTAINAVQNQIVKKEKTINALGVKTRFTDDNGVDHQRDFIDVVLDVMEKTGGEGQWNKIFDPSKSGQALSGMLAAFKNAGKGAKGKARVQEMLRGALPTDMTGTQLVKEMDKDFDLAMDTPAEKINQALLKVKDAMVDEFMPAIERLAQEAPEIAKKVSAAVKEIGNLARFVIDNPGTAAATVGAAGALVGVGKAGAVGLARFAGDRLAQFGHGIRIGAGPGGKLVGGALGAIGNVTSSAGSTPVYIVGAAPGVFGGIGGGGFEIPGAAGGAAGGGAVTNSMIGALGAVGAGFAAFVTLAPVLQDVLEKIRDKKPGDVDPEERKKVLKGRADERAAQEEGVYAILSGEDAPEKVKAARETLAQFFPDIAKKVDSGELSPLQAGGEVAKLQTAPGLNLGKGADGTLQQNKLSDEQFNKLAEAIETLTKAASKASTTLNTVSPPTGTSSFNFTPLKTF